MDLFSILSYLNKLSLLAFIVTLFALSYQLYLLKKENKVKKSDPLIPKFKEEITTEIPNYTKINPALLVSSKDNKNKWLYFAIFFSSFLVLVIFLLIIKKSEQKPITDSSQLVRYVTSTGIKVYNNNWIELKDSEIKKLKPGDKIVIGIETIKDSRIDKARIRINRSQWFSDDVTDKFNQTKNIFYRDYVIASDDSTLKIEAELHSKTNNWLSE
jgi:hypothetical protein